MKIKIIKIVSSLILVLITSLCSAQGDWNNVYSNDDVTRDTISKNGYTLFFINKDSAFDKAFQQRMINVFFTVYPEEVKTYNPESLKVVTIIIDPAYKGVAATSDGIIRVNPEWMKKHPEDLDVITHEAMHIVQSYPNGAGPGWITEGIADYVRYKFGVNNEAGNWSLPELNSKHSYKDAYRVTARFFLWIEKNYNKNIVKKLDADMRKKEYTSEFWKSETGKTIDELWTFYAADSSL